MKNNNNFWKSLETDYTDEELFNNKVEDFKQQHRNCLIIAIARFIKHNKISVSSNEEVKSNNDLLNFVKNYFTDWSEQKKGNIFITKTKNINELENISSKTLYYEDFDQKDIEYILSHKNRSAVVAQKYNNKEAHFEFIKDLALIEENTEISINFTHMKIFIY